MRLVFCVYNKSTKSWKSSCGKIWNNSSILCYVWSNTRNYWYFSFCNFRVKGMYTWVFHEWRPSTYWMLAFMWWYTCTHIHVRRCNSTHHAYNFIWTDGKTGISCWNKSEKLRSLILSLVYLIIIIFSQYRNICIFMEFSQYSRNSEKTHTIDGMIIEKCIRSETFRLSVASVGWTRNDKWVILFVFVFVNYTLKNSKNFTFTLISGPNNSSILNLI